MLKSCCASLDGGCQPLTAESVLLVGVPARAMPQPVAVTMLGQQLFERRRSGLGGRRSAQPDRDDAGVAVGIERRRQADAHGHADGDGGIEVDHPLEGIGHDETTRDRIARQPRIRLGSIGREDEIVGNRKAHHAIDLAQRVRRRIGGVGQHDEAIRQRVGARQWRLRRDGGCHEAQIARGGRGILRLARGNDEACAVGAEPRRQRCPGAFVRASQRRIVRSLLRCDARAPIRAPRFEFVCADGRRRRGNADVVRKDSHAQLGSAVGARELRFQADRQQHEGMIGAEGRDDLFRRLVEPRAEIGPRRRPGTRCGGTRGLRSVARRGAQRL